MIGDDEEVAAAGRPGLANQLHVGFLRGAARLAPVAGDTGADDVLPGVPAAPVAGDDVVQRELTALLTAVLAGVAVPVENLVACQLLFPARPLNHPGQPDDRWQGGGFTYRVNLAQAGFHH